MQIVLAQPWQPTALLLGWLYTYKTMCLCMVHISSHNIFSIHLSPHSVWHTPIIWLWTIEKYISVNLCNPMWLSTHSAMFIVYWYIRLALRLGWGLFGDTWSLTATVLTGDCKTLCWQDAQRSQNYVEPRCWKSLFMSKAKPIYIFWVRT